MNQVLELPVEALTLEVSESGALPVCLCLWLENPYRLVSLDEIMTFDAGKFSTVSMFLSGSQTQIIFQQHGGQDFELRTLEERHRKFLLEGIENGARYCEKVGFRMAQISLDRILDLAKNDHFTVGSMSRLMADAAQRLRDEAASIAFFKIPIEKAGYYRAFSPDAEANNPVEQQWASIFAAFASTKYDATEAFKCFALGRSTACVFHLMRVLEIGLCVLAGRFNVPSSHTNWHTIIEGTEKAIRDIPNDPARPVDWKEQQEYFSQVASHFMFLKDAWRNYTAHARGKYTEEEVDMIIVNVRAFMQKLATRFHE